MYCTVASDTIESVSYISYWRAHLELEGAVRPNPPLNIILLAENFRGARAPCAPVVPPPMHCIHMSHMWSLYYCVSAVGGMWVCQWPTCSTLDCHWCWGHWLSSLGSLQHTDCPAVIRMTSSLREPLPLIWQHTCTCTGDLPSLLLWAWLALRR